MKIDCLDKGYVRLVDHMGEDLSVANAARVSFDKESKEFSEKDAKLLKFLAAHGHESPFRHAFISLEMYAPLMVCRQLWKYCVASSHIDDSSCWNESSRRYITENTEFMLPAPEDWRKAPADKKQGSEGRVDLETGRTFSYLLETTQLAAEGLYNRAIEEGICPEQARLFLPAYGLYVRWRWAGSLSMFLHVLKQRLNHDAQKETQEYAKAISTIVKELYPHAHACFIEGS